MVGVKAVGLVAVGGREPEPFEALVRAYQRRVYGFAYQQLRDPAEAQDLAQEIFVKLYRNLAAYDTSRPFEPWFWRLAANVAVNYRRRRVPAPAEPRELAVSDPAPSDLAAALAALEPAQRLPLVLHYYADLPLDAVAAALGISVGAAKSRLHRARAQLRRTLESEGA